MLFRNSDWSRTYLDNVAHFGQFPPNMTTEQVSALPLLLRWICTSKRPCLPCVSSVDDAWWLTGLQGPHPHICWWVQVLQTSLPSYDIGMFEQNAAVYVLMQQPTLMSNVYFEHSYCINCWYKDLDSPLIRQPAFIVHFAGCQLCSGLHAEKIGPCAAIFVRMFAEAFSRLLQLAAMSGQ